jgi:iron complex transport system ATP-binding protein
LTILFTTHDPGHALHYADHALLILESTVFAFGAPREVMTEENLYRLYGVKLRRLTLSEDGVKRDILVPPAAGGRTPCWIA